VLHQQMSLLLSRLNRQKRPLPGSAVGNFQNDGLPWSWQPVAVNVHDFLADVLGDPVLCGICDLQ
jgi:hypothetical protein